MRYEVRVTPLAEEDVEEAYRWLLERSPQAAGNFVKGFERALGKLETSPLRCASIVENLRLKTHYRHLILAPYRVIFRLDGKKVFIARVIHSARKTPRYIENKTKEEI